MSTITTLIFSFFDVLAVVVDVFDALEKIDVFNVYLSAFVFSVS